MSRRNWATRRPTVPKAYDSQALRDKLGELGIEDRIAYMAGRNKPLVNWRRAFASASSARTRR
jgi:hypothetical protein